jgi:hypothetical protein
LLPEIELADLRRIEGSQEIIVQRAPARALATLPLLVREPADRDRLVALIERAIAFRSGGRTMAARRSNARCWARSGKRCLHRCRACAT